MVYKKFKLLVFSRSFPPSIGGTSTVLMSLFSQFATQEVTVISGRYGHGTKNDWPEYALKFERINQGTPRQLYRLNLGLLEHYWIWRRTQTAKVLLREEKYTAILGVIPGPEYVVSAYLTHLASNLPFFVYYLDTTIPYPSEVNWRRQILNQYEDRWNSAAQDIFVISEGLAGDLQKRLGVERHTILRHSLTPDILASKVGVTQKVGNPARILFIGSVRGYTHVRPLNIVIEVLEAWTDREVRLEIYTKQSRERLISAGIKDSTVWKKPSYCSLEQLLKAERSADLILVPLDNQSPLQPLLKTVFPTKTVEAMVANVPILVLAPEDTFTARYARSTGFALVVSDFHKDVIRAAILRLLTDKDLRRRLIQQARKTAEENHAARQVAEIFRRKVLQGTANESWFSTG